MGSYPHIITIMAIKAWIMMQGIPLPPKYHFWLSENYDFFSQSMPILTSPSPPCPRSLFLEYSQNTHWSIKKHQYPITNYIIKIVLSFPLWCRSIAITGTMKIVHNKNELALRALWFIGLIILDIANSLIQWFSLLRAITNVLWFSHYYILALNWISILFFVMNS